MKIVIITEGGKQIGFGHITRCVALGEAFEEKGIMPEFLVNGDEAVEDLLKDKKYLIFNWIKEKDKLFKIIKAADIIIIDSYLAGKVLYDKISKMVNGRLVMIDDYNRIAYPKGIVVNPSIYGEDLDYPKKEGVVYLSGNDYTILRKEFWANSNKRIRESIESIMVTFGGNDTRNMTLRILQYLNKSYPQLTKKVIIGKGFKNIKEIKKLQNSRTELIYYPNAKEMKQEMLKADIAISAGGQTLYELARIGVPTIAIAVVDNQLNNIKEWQRVGFIEYAGRWEEARSLDTLAKKIDLLMDRHRRQKKSKTGKQKVDGKGAKRIYRLVVNRLENISNGRFQIPVKN
jgi:UDP-2,4-diacetamido-2,4,6-trideoxy-beta-L-altropyranose hydrolase